MSNEQPASETKGIAVKLRQLRMRMVTMGPGGVFGPIHDHKGDRARSTSCNDRNTTHWLEHRGTIPAVEIWVDIVRHE
jgi:hypothetical protein